MTSIGDWALKDCNGLTSVMIPEGVANIGYGAFRDCSGLTSVMIPSSVTSIGSSAFRYCHSLTSVTIPEGVTSIGAWAFQLCFCLTSVTIPSSVTSIGGGAFSACHKLTSVTIPSSVTSIGDSAFRGCSGLTSMTIPSSVMIIGDYAFSGCSGLTTFVVDNQNPNYQSKNGLLLSKDGKTLIAGVNGEVIIPEGVTSIGDWAFSDCYGLTSVTIPSSVTSIGRWAFFWCSELTSVTIPSSVTNIGERAFKDCSGLKSVTIPSSVTSIGDGAFYGCNGLTSVTIPSSVTSIGREVFSGCDGLTSVTIPSSITSIGSQAFSCCDELKSVMIPEGVTSIGDGAFSYCSGLTSVTIPLSVTSIGDGAFCDCSGLGAGVVIQDDWALTVNGECPAVVNIPSGVKGIAGGAFCGCDRLTSVTIPSSVTSIGDYAFWGCSGLGTGVVIQDGWVLTVNGECPAVVNIPSGAKGIVGGAFRCCSGLKSVTIPLSVTSIGRGTFEGCIELTSVAIPEGVTSIGDYAFCDCYSLTSVAIPEGVTSIGCWAFHDCYGLTSVTIPSGVMSIGDYAFSSCSKLTSVTIPSSVTSIGAWAFYDCYVTSVTIPSSVKIIGEGAFHAALRIVYVDKGDLSRVKTMLIEAGLDTTDISFVERDVPILVPGAKVDFDTGLVGYTPKNLPSGLKYDKNTGRITGTPTKPTGDAGVTVTFTKKGAETQMLQFVVSAIPTINVTLEGDTEKCKVTGANKAYLVGKKVSLSATAPKGTAFVGWFKDGEPWPSAEESVKPKLSFVMTPENLELVAKFEKEKMSLACLGLAAGTFTVGVDGTGDGIPLEITTQSGVKSVKATKLPTGMKLVKDKTTGEWMITGAPTKAGSFNVVLTVTAVSGAVQSITIPVTVEALPSWLVGTYTGMVGRGEGKSWMAYGTFSLTVAATGKISAKVVVPSGSYSFTATRWDEYLEDAFAVQMKTKKGETLSLIVDGALPWYEARISDAEHGNMFTIPNVEPFRVVAWRNEFGKDGEIAKDPSASDFISKIIALKNVALRVTGGKTEGYDLSLLDSNDRTADLKLTFDAKGNVKYTGKVDGVSISGKTVLLIDGSDYYTILDLVVPIKKAEVMYFVFGFERDELHNPEYDFEIIRMDYQ